MYQSFYNFSDKPFKLAPDASFFYSSHGHKRALSYLQYGISQAEGFVVITGDIGAGKTTLIQALLKDLDEKHHMVATITSSNLNPEELMAMTAASFGLPYQKGGKVQLLKALESYMLNAAWEEKRVLIVVDEAQNLPTESLEELRMLSNIQVAGTSTLQILLLGQPELFAIINSKRMTQLKQRVVASYHLSPMSREETENYIQFRLKRVARGALPMFSVVAQDGIYQYTGGVPRLINTFCDRLLLYGYLEGLYAFDKTHINNVISEIEQESASPESSIDDNSVEIGEVENSRLKMLEEKVEEMERQLQIVRDLLIKMVKVRKDN